MELILLIGIAVVVVLQVLNLTKKIEVKSEGNDRIETRLSELDAKLLKVETGMELKIQNVISKEIVNITEKILKGSSETSQTLSKNNEALGSKFSGLERKIDGKLAENRQENLKNASEIREQVTKAISEMKEETTKTLGKTNEDLVVKFGTLESKIVKTLGDTNEQVIQKFSALEKNIGMNLSGSAKTSLKTSEELKTRLNKEIGDFKDKLGENLDNKFNQLSDTVTSRLDKINEKVEDKLKEGFEKTNKTFANILERLSKIDEAQKKIDSLSTEIVSLQDVLTDKKSRGIFGEVQLNQVLYSVFGEKNDKAFKVQHKLSTGVIADSVLLAPEPVGVIAIDSKFPLENFKRMTDKKLGEVERAEATKAFKRDIKSHIDAIGGKYIIPGETSSQAIMFLPAEAIFAEINAYHPDLVEYSQKKKVWICSPTTLMAVLTTLQVVLQNAEREKHAHIIQEELIKLSTEFKRYETRWDDLAKHMETVNNDVKKIHTTTDKIGRRFKEIERVDLGDRLIEEA